MSQGPLKLIEIVHETGAKVVPMGENFLVVWAQTVWLFLNTSKMLTHFPHFVHMLSWFQFYHLLGNDETIVEVL